jgi:hypothetical protein
VGRGELQGVPDPFEVVVRVGLEIGIPLDLLGEDHFAVDQSGALAIRAAEVEPDPTAAKVAPQRQVRGALGWETRLVDDRERQGALEKFADKVSVKRADAAGDILTAKRLGQGGRQRAAEQYFVAAAGPQ